MRHFNCTHIGIIVCLLFSPNLQSQVVLPQNNQPIVLNRLFGNNYQLRPCERFYLQFVQICEGQKLRVVDSFYTKVGTYTNITRTSEGCDSIITTVLNLIPSQRTDTSVTVCAGKCFKIGTRCYAQSGNYADTLKTRFGCDSIVKLNLTVLKPDSTQQNATICEGQSFRVGNRLYFASGNFRDTIVQAEGCFRLIKTNLTVTNKILTTQNPTICENGSLTVGTRTYNRAGVYLDTLKASTGCDSIVTTNLMVTTAMKRTIDTTVCSGKSVTIAGNMYNRTGTYTIPIKTSGGCDSIITLNLFVPRPPNMLKSATLCGGKDTLINGRRYNQTGIFRDTVKAVFGCDSFVNVISISVLPLNEARISISFCRNKTNLTAGTFRVVYPSVTGCDSVIVTTIKITDSVTIRQTKDICVGDSVRVGNNVYKTMGYYTDFLKTVDGCDSIIYTNLTVYPSYTVTQSKSLCKGDSLKVGNKVYKTTGTYVDKLTSTRGCDSTITSIIKVSDVPVLSLPKVFQPRFCSDSIALNPKADTASKYVWRWRNTPCASCPNPKIKPILTTTYYVTVTDKTNSCAVSDSVKVVLEGTYMAQIPNAFTPNGDNINEIFNIVSDDCIQSVKRLQIFTRWGVPVFDKTNLSPRNNEGWNGLFKNNPLGADVYLYVMEIIFTDGTSQKVSGEVNLIH
ncbi:MAG: gliding motility-associated C-terminal domain-containing protein [Saprospiraceae bacterium]|nr:gliding motility-associated C-terminal domain-containing protein [Saprospiraceae bacterium]